MKFVFRVAYRTVIGESLWLQMKSRHEGEIANRLLPMRWSDMNHWQIEIEDESSFEYRYVFRRDDGLELPEHGDFRKWQACTDGGSVILADDWRSAGSEDRVYEAKVFEITGTAHGTFQDKAESGNHEFHLFMVRMPVDTQPCLLGSCERLGNWDFAKAIPMVEVEPNYWQVGVDLPFDQLIEYKYGIYSKSAKRAIGLEEGSQNRLLPERLNCDFIRISDECYRRSADQRYRASGVAIPLFSMRSEAGCGVGEFPDLKPMGDWVASCGMKLLQILPINDTTSTRSWRDSYPYSAISVCALHPAYLRVDEMSVALPEGWDFQRKRDELNRHKQLDYEAVMAVKWQITREAFDLHRESILSDRAFIAFREENRDWVMDYAVFSVKRDQYGTADFHTWREWQNHDPEKIAALSDDVNVLYYVWLQYELDRQLSDAVKHLHSKGVALKGDLPIGVDKHSVDAWVSPRLFHMDRQTGAPPDAFAVKGQNWGFPTYDWDEMRKDGYAWWRSRFERLSRYFDAYRIDHILGFFRIWQIPSKHVDGIMGWFEPALPVRIEEFEASGVNFDHDRFCRPCIHDNDLLDLFGKFAGRVKQDFLIKIRPGVYSLNDEFSDQRSIIDYFDGLIEGDWVDQIWLRDTLLELVAEVLFFEVDGSAGTLFHPRMGMVETRSFKSLNPEVQEILRQIHEDYFYLRQERYWEAQAYEKLPAMRSASNMLLCGEDLGMVPACVPGVMNRLGMLSLEIQRWPKIYGAVFSDPLGAPYMSVVSTGTHDMETLRQWWRDDVVVRNRFAAEMLGLISVDEDLSGELACRIIQRHLISPAMWAVFPFQDLLAMDEKLRSDDIDGERINVPAITPYFWRWRMEMNVETLLKQTEFTQVLRDMIKAAGR